MVSDTPLGLTNARTIKNNGFLVFQTEHLLFIMSISGSHFQSCPGGSFLSVSLKGLGGQITGPAGAYRLVRRNAASSAQAPSTTLAAASGRRLSSSARRTRRHRRSGGQGAPRRKTWLEGTRSMTLVKI